ncbi:MAG TPA: AIR synthase-related protein, partial [Pyrinomonadaceae bacterium]|jgi:phosphoribosylformylglycinamidine synthase|nr:AIR synthase-related protein [Pyrinomonadaceae bacterium]
VRRIIQPGFKTEGDLIALLGTTHDDLSISEYAATVQGHTTEQILQTGRLATIDLKLEQAVQSACLQAAEESLLRSAHDCSDGGLAIALAESCFSTLNRPSIGAEISLCLSDISGTFETATAATTYLFSESPSRIIISFSESAGDRIAEIAEQFNCPFLLLGRVGGEGLSIAFNGQPAISQNVNALESHWRTALGKRLQAEALAAAAE